MGLEFLQKAKKSEIMAATAVVSALICVGYYFFFLAPVASRFAALFRETSKIQSMIDKAELSINNLSKLKAEIETLESRESFYSSKLPREEEFPAILESLSDMARNNRVKITKILPMKEPDTFSGENAVSDIYSEKTIAINAQSGYHQLGMFIAELEGAKRFMEVSDIKIEAGRLNPKRHNVQLTVKAFILKGGEK